MAAKGQGAPLVPMLDYVLFADSKRGRVLQNIGGIANLTAMPAACTADELIAFDTGPGNMVMDALTQKLFNKPYDRNGSIAERGQSLDSVVEQMMRNSYFARSPPGPQDANNSAVSMQRSFLPHSTCKRKTRRRIWRPRLRSLPKALRRAINISYEEHARQAGDYIVSGGGAKNSALTGC